LTQKLESQNPDMKDILEELWTNPGALIVIGSRMHYLLVLINRLRYIKNINFN